MRNVDPIFITNIITQLFILNFAKISVLQAVTTGYIKPYQLKGLTIDDLPKLSRRYQPTDTHDRLD